VGWFALPPYAAAGSRAAAFAASHDASGVGNLPLLLRRHDVRWSSPDGQWIGSCGTRRSRRRRKLGSRGGGGDGVEGDGGDGGSSGGTGSIKWCGGGIDGSAAAVTVGATPVGVVAALPIPLPLRAARRASPRVGACAIRWRRPGGAALRRQLRLLSPPLPSAAEFWPCTAAVARYTSRAGLGDARWAYNESLSYAAINRAGERTTSEAWMVSPGPRVSERSAFDVVPQGSPASEDAKILTSTKWHDLLSLAPPDTAVRTQPHRAGNLGGSFLPTSRRFAGQRNQPRTHRWLHGRV